MNQKRKAEKGQKERIQISIEYVKGLKEGSWFVFFFPNRSLRSIISNAVRSMIRMINNYWNSKSGSHCSLPREEFQITNIKR